MELREYQQKYLTSIVKGYPGKMRPLIHLATGGGKSVLFKKCAELAIKKNKKVLFLVAGKTILEQAVAKHFSSISNDISFIQGSRKYHFAQILCASIDTLSRRGKIHDKIIENYDMILVDEAHEATANRYLDFLNKVPQKKWIIGFSATPYLIGNKGHSFWSNVIKEVTVSELVDQGWLMRPKIFSAPIMSTKVRSVAGDFDKKQLFEKNDTLKVYSEVVQEYEKRAKGLKAICFAINRTHAMNLCNQFNKAGYVAEYADGETEQEDREKIIKRFENGSTTILCNVDIFSTGVDIPKIECGIMCRPTKSKVKWIQQVGRVLRTHPDVKNCIILDHGGNCPRIGHPLEDFEAEMQDRDKKLSESKQKELEISLRACSSCHFILENPRIELCPECGEPIKTARQIAQEKEAQLVEIERAFKINEESKKDESLLAFIERYIDMDNIPRESIDGSIAPKAFVQNLLKVIRAGKAKKPFLFYKVWEKYDQESLEFINYPQWFKEKVGIEAGLDLSLIYD